MAASQRTVDQIIKVMLKYVDKKTAVRMARDLHDRVEGNRSVVDTFSRIALKLIEQETSHE